MNWMSHAIQSCIGGGLALLKWTDVWSSRRNCLVLSRRCYVVLIWSRFIIWLLGGCQGLPCLLLLVFLDQSFLNVAKVVLLKTSQLNQILGPSRLDTTVLPTSRGNTAGYKVLVGIGQLVVLERKQHEVIEVLLQKIYLLLCSLYWTDITVYVDCVCWKHHSQSHKNFGDVKKYWVSVEVEANTVQNNLLLFAQLIFVNVEFFWYWGSVDFIETILVSPVIHAAFPLGWLVTRQLAQKLLAAGHMRV